MARSKNGVTDNLSSKTERIPSLTDNEGALLSLVRRMQPVTGYKIVKTYRTSPVAAFNTSVGQVYPMIRRFSKEGLLVGTSVEDDARGTETWCCSDKGVEMLRNWVFEVKPQHLLPEDPLRTKVTVFELLSKDEQVQWVLSTKAKFAKKLEEQEAYIENVLIPFRDVVNDNAVSSIRAKMDWLDRLLFRLTEINADTP